MIENKILIPVDFSVAADKAVEFGVFRRIWCILS